ncbi:MAG TPA: 4,5-DOPA dioxygenase extradiol [Ilumatobacteraceae bacterium]
MATTTTPAVFIGHGSPMNTLERNRYTEAWRALGASIERPRAVLAISAHWYINATAVTAMALPKVIHDFYGFPRELFEFDYPAPGDPDLADQVVDLVRPRWVGLDVDSWGLDHGTWSVLAHVFPEADVPVVQLAINASQPPEYHLEIGQRLAPLRERGVLILGSGNVVHNLGGMDPRLRDDGFDWAHRFDEAVRDVMSTTPGDLVHAVHHPDAPLAVPTPDHFLPLLYVAGVADAAGRSADVLIDGYAYGSLSMTCFAVGIDVEPSVDPRPAAPIPPADVVPPDELNL